MASIAIGAHAALAAAPVRCAHQQGNGGQDRHGALAAELGAERHGWQPMWSPPMSQPNQRIGSGTRSSASRSAGNTDGEARQRPRDTRRHRLGHAGRRGSLQLPLQDVVETHHAQQHEDDRRERSRPGSRDGSERAAAQTESDPTRTERRAEWRAASCAGDPRLRSAAPRAPRVDRAPGARGYISIHPGIPDRRAPRVGPAVRWRVCGNSDERTNADGGGRQPAPSQGRRRHEAHGSDGEPLGGRGVEMTSSQVGAAWGACLKHCHEKQEALMRRIVPSATREYYNMLLEFSSYRQGAAYDNGGLAAPPASGDFRDGWTTTQRWRQPQVEIRACCSSSAWCSAP